MKSMHTFVRKLDAAAVPGPLRRPWKLGVMAVQDLIRCDLLKQASAMAYVTLLSLVPSLVAIFCVVSLFSPLVGDGTNLMVKLRGFILANLAAGSGESVVSYLDKMLGGLDLAKIGWSSFASVLVTLILLLRQIEEALNRIWLIRKGRNMLTRFMYFWTFLTLGAVVVAVALGVSSGFSAKGLLPFSSEAAVAQSLVPAWAVGFAGSFLFFFFLYKVVPNCIVGTRNAAIGAATSALLLGQAGRFYAMYVTSAQNYQTLYGALAQLPLFLMWLYICWIIILLGALLSWRMQEGFPQEQDGDTLDQARAPLDQLRNVQVKAALPLLGLLAIYKNFQDGTGRGLSGLELAHALKLPASWVADALDALGELGYVIASKTAADATDGPALTDPYFPAYPASLLPVGKLIADLGRPMTEWVGHWHHELPMDLVEALKMLHPRTSSGFRPETMLADALKRIPGVRQEEEQEAS